MKALKLADLAVPATVYRLQLNEAFPIAKAIKILPYLKALGIEAVYCSPYFQSYSLHGYDITNPNQFNLKIGRPEEFDLFYRKLKELHMMHIIDVVPNHMGIKGGQNGWWQDLLENGHYSLYANFFDINWSPEKRQLQDKVLLPILGAPYGKALAKGEIHFSFQEGQFHLQYADSPLPIAPHTYAIILETELESLKHTHADDDPDLKAYLELIDFYRAFPIASQERKSKKEEGSSRLVALMKRSPKMRSHIARLVTLFNAKQNHVNHSVDLLDKLLEGQFYRLSYWRVAGHEINYRRFFNLSELVSIKIEEEYVLEAHHELLFQLIERGVIQGVRIDHPDGLYDPIQYFHRLRERFTLYTVAEKILERKERLPDEWEVEGTVGYEFLNILNGIFIVKQNEEALTEIYKSFVGPMAGFEELLYAAKKYFATDEMASDVDSLGLRLDHLSETIPEYRDFTRHDLTEAIAEVISCFPVYRSYLGPQGKPNKRDAHYIQIAIGKARVKAAHLDPSIFDFLEKVLLVKLKWRHDGEEALYRQFILRFQQLTGPIMAKSLEDTVCYIYNRFLSLNEVGGDPRHFGISLGEFHAYNREKRESWPFGFLASSTHDTKRSEDVRMRLNVLSEFPEKWALEVKKWSIVNQKYKKEGPSENTEYFIYQTLLGVWPRVAIRKDHFQAVCERIWQIILKSLREAKQETSWRAPNASYEQAVHDFFLAILAPGKNNRFRKLFTEFLALIDRYGAWNSLSQFVLKCGSPGVAEVYQGNERLNYRLVDPDNRQPVDFDFYRKELRSIRNRPIEELFARHELSKVKMALTTKAFHYRIAHKPLFLEGDYLPLSARGARKENVVAFMRRLEDQWVIIVAARFYTQLAAAEWDLPLGQHAWGNTELILPSDWNHPILTDLFTGNKVKTRRHTLKLADLFEKLPVSWLIAS